MKNFEEHMNKQNELVKQVMREDIQRRSFKSFAYQFKTDKMLFLVLHVNEHLAKKKTPYGIQEQLNKYFKTVDNKVFSKKSKKKLSRHVVIENMTNFRRNHVQVVIECPKHLNKFKLRDILRTSLNNHIVRLEHIAEVYDFESLIDYNTKDIQSVKPTQIDKTFDEVNSYVH